MNPPGPFVSISFTVSEADIAAHPGIYGCCGEGESGCGSFGFNECEEPVTDCSACPDGAAQTYHVEGFDDTYSNPSATPGCSDCEAYVGGFDVEHTTGCFWEGPAACGVTPILELAGVLFSGFYTLSVYGFAIYRIPDINWDCNGPNVLELFTTPTPGDICLDLPTTVTVSPG